MPFEYLVNLDLAIGYPPSAIRSYTGAHDTAQVKEMPGGVMFCYAAPEHLLIS
jgi:hypothetical protein